MLCPCHKTGYRLFMRKPRPNSTEITDDAWAVGAPSLPVIAPQSLQRPSAVRVMVTAFGSIGRGGASWRLFSRDFPPVEAVSPQSQRWGCMADGLTPSAAIDGLSWAERRAGQHRPAAQGHCRRRHPAVAQQQRCAGRLGRRYTQEKAKTRPPQWPSGSP